ncbi:hypothetical protein M406DRAFT_329132 [Cryphonectria parasitica EP155]|uniref:Zn(2)-C6 fungal-type domain-containing protein n=1 Tax=Cryphonectria parasitica (strain ATCC 38755 / EP155) TaxID=660469 RepID=A0A9P5CS08_CRYP1|nr:uncharacterized protein M406DRAFT_329132 [Cryphonectria parasitica EP155]KAF3768092.1 hypothetical protein M406DRAFT_329132 [Cryphonectria parasitica EP155]
MPRLSRGCLRCRQRKVRCDEGRPSCQRCIARDELCVGYRDESDLIFRHETHKIVGNLSTGGIQRSRAVQSSAVSDVNTEEVPAFYAFSTATSSSATGRQRQRSASVDSGRVVESNVPTSSTSATYVPPDALSQLSIGSPSQPRRYVQDFTWLKPSVKPPRAQPLSRSDDDAVQKFFAKYTLLPYDFHAVDALPEVKPTEHGAETRAQRASQGFLEFLPCTFEEVNVRGRFALRWAVQAAALADAASQASPQQQIPEDTNNDASSEIEAELVRRALETYGQALSALAESLGKQGKIPDDYDLMTVVILDIFETLFLPGNVSKGCHAQGMAQILRKRGHDQFYDARGWSLFRLAHHRLQKQALAFNLPPVPVIDELFEHLNDQMPFVRLERDASRISSLCAKGRALRAALQNLDQEQRGATELLNLVREMQSLDREAVAWRQGPEWSYAVLKTSDLAGDEAVLSTFPDTIHIHPDIWTAYEWDYHHTARVLMHKQLLACLHRAAMLSTGDDEESTCVASLLIPLEAESVAIIRSLVTKVLATVPQMMGDIDHTGHVRRSQSLAPRCRAIGAYFLLWPIKIFKGDLLQDISTDQQRHAAAAIFERVREYTGMKSLLGDESLI